MNYKFDTKYWNSPEMY